MDAVCITLFNKVNNKNEIKVYTEKSLQSLTMLKRWYKHCEYKMWFTSEITMKIYSFKRLFLCLTSINERINLRVQSSWQLVLFSTLQIGSIENYSNTLPQSPPEIKSFLINSFYISNPFQLLNFKPIPALSQT